MSETVKKLLNREKSEIIGDFLTWLENQGAVICEPVAGMMDMPYCLPVNKSINQWCADYFQIDLDKLEQERLAFLQSLATSVIPIVNMDEEEA